MIKRTLKISIALLVLVSIAAAAVSLLDRPEGARGKSPALPITDTLTPGNQLAQDLALSDPQVIDLTTGRRSEVFNVFPVGLQLTEQTQVCRNSDCRQVNIYNFEENVTVTVIVDIKARRVVDVLSLSGSFPPGNARLLEVAIQVILNSPEVAAELGRSPGRDEVYPMPSSLAGTDCGATHPCLGATFRVGDRFLWAHVDLTTETFAGIGWSPAPEFDGQGETFTPDGGCPTPGAISKDGWELDYSVTASDGFRISDVTYKGFAFLANVKLAEWHVDYGNSGFIDATGCTGGGGKFAIFPYGNPQVVDILNVDQEVIGFDLYQDFRMNQWGSSCNYRYEQHYQFFKDGRFRIVGGAFGKGCGTNGTYRPLIRIDLAVDGDADDRFATWDGLDWVNQLTEFWASQTGTVTADGYAWRVKDTVLDTGFYIEPGQGQFDDAGLGDDAFIYVVKYKSSEGSADMNAIGSCCNNNFQQGPETFINGESINGENIVLWYIPQLVTIFEDNDPEYYCWTVNGEPNPETYPCFGGPMFYPFGFDFPPDFEVYLPLTTNE